MTLPRCCEYLTPHAEDSDPLIGIEVATDRAARKVGLCVEEAARRISELGRHAHHCVCVAAVAVMRIGRDRSRANKHQCCQHPQPPIISRERYSATKPTVVGFTAAAFAVALGLGVKTAI